VRAVLDPNVLISALLSPQGTPAELLRAWQGGQFEVIASPVLLAELERALAYPKLRKHISSGEAEEFVAWLRASAELVADPKEPPARGSRDPGDDYLLALAERERAALVSGDDDLLELHRHLPVFDPAAFIRLLDARLG
jgi:putative PIN family toxin of toxin-antitoxin system